MTEAVFIAKSYIDFIAGDNDCAGKFVLLSQGKILHLILSPLVLTPFHAHIVELYLGKENRAEVEMQTGPKCKILSPGWKIQGGGHFHIDWEVRTLIFSGKSTVYGKYDMELLKPHQVEITTMLGLKDFTAALK